MAVARKPVRKPASSKVAAKEAAAERFIKGAAPVPIVQVVPDTPIPATRRKPAMIRFDAELLARVDRAAKRRGVSRSAWIAFTVSRALDEEG